MRLRADSLRGHVPDQVVEKQATAWRYVDEALEVLASWAPGLHEALTGLGEGDHVIVDGTLIPPTASAPISRTTRRNTRSTA
jgi:hypothetical protein